MTLFLLLVYYTSGDHSSLYDYGVVTSTLRDSGKGLLPLCRRCMSFLKLLLVMKSGRSSYHVRVSYLKEACWRRVFP